MSTDPKVTATEVVVEPGEQPDQGKANEKVDEKADEQES